MKKARICVEKQLNLRTIMIQNLGTTHANHETTQIPVYQVSESVSPGSEMAQTGSGVARCRMIA